MAQKKHQPNNLYSSRMGIIKTVRSIDKAGYHSTNRLKDIDFSGTYN